MSQKFLLRQNVTQSKALALSDCLSQFMRLKEIHHLHHTHVQGEAVDTEVTANHPEHLDEVTSEVAVLSGRLAVWRQQPSLRGESRPSRCS